MNYLSGLDWSIVLLYFIGIFAIAFKVAVKDKSTRADSAGYFLAGRHAGWVVIGASLFASNIGSEHLVGLAGTAASSGVAVAQFEVLASLILLMLGWVFVPFYLKSGVYTMPEFMERRYSSQARWYLAIISIVGYVLTKISVTIAAGGIVFESLMGINFWTGAIIVVVLTGIYTVFGGLKAVLYTDFVQMIILILGAIFVTVIGLGEVGGWSRMVALSGDGFMSMWKPMSNPDFPWTGIILGAPILGTWYWCTDQYIVQRVLSAKNQDHARRGTIFGGFLKLLPLFIFVIPGVIAHALMKKGVIHFDQPDAALPTMIGQLLPSGLKGLVVAGLLAALMSSLSSVFNSCSSLITLDIYKRIYPQTSEKRLVWVGQMATLVLVALGLLWIPMMKHISGQLYQYLQSVQAYIAPPIAAVFLLGLFNKRLNAKGAMASLWTGFILGIGRLVLELNKESLSGIVYVFADINFLHFAFLMFVICSIVLVVVSFTTNAPDSKQIEGLTFATKSDDGAQRNMSWRMNDMVLSVFLVCCVFVLWIIFS